MITLKQLNYNLAQILHLVNFKTLFKMFLHFFSFNVLSGISDFLIICWSNHRQLEAVCFSCSK